MYSIHILRHDLHGDFPDDLGVFLDGALRDVAGGADLAVGEAALGGYVGVVADHAVLDHTAVPNGDVVHDDRVADLHFFTDHAVLA